MRLSPVHGIPVAFVCLIAGAGSLAHAESPSTWEAPGDHELLAEDEGQPAGAAEPAIEGGPAAAAGASTPAAKPTEEKTGIHKYIPGAYATFELRHRVLRVMDHDSGGYYLSPKRLIGTKHVQHDSPKWELRPTIGSTFFDGSLDTSWTYVVADPVGTRKFAKSDIFNATQWNIVEGKFNEDSPWSFGPTAYTDFYNGADRAPALSYSDLGVTGEATYQWAIPTGSLAVRVYANPNVELYGVEQRRKNQAPLRRESPAAGDTQANLQDVASTPPATASAEAAAPATSTMQKDPFYLAYYGVSATYKPKACADFSAQLGLDVAEVWRPIYKETLRPGNTEPSAAFSHYDADAVSFARLTLKYKLNDLITISNQTRHYTGGIFQRTLSEKNPDTTGQIGDVSWENRLSLTMTLL